MMILVLQPDDFDTTAGRKKIIVFLHSLEAKVRDLEHKIHHLEKREADMKKDIEDLLVVQLTMQK